MHSSNSMEKRCRQCGRTFYGADNKLSCSTRCKNKYNYQKNSDPASAKALQQKALRKNYRILERLSRQHVWSKNAIPRHVLEYEGYRHEFFTSQSVGQGWPGGVRWVYDLGLEKGPDGSYRLYNQEYHARMKKR